MHEWVEPGHVYIHWTGGKGFHIVGHFKAGPFRPIEQVERMMAALLSKFCNDVNIFPKDQPALFDPFVVLDLAPVRRRGVYRNVFSIHANAGGVCVPVERTRLENFNPDVHATVDFVMKHARTRAAPETYEELLESYFKTLNT